MSGAADNSFEMQADNDVSSESDSLILQGTTSAQKRRRSRQKTQTKQEHQQAMRSARETPNVCSGQSGERDKSRS